MILRLPYISVKKDITKIIIAEYLTREEMMKISPVLKTYLSSTANDQEYYCYWAPTNTVNMNYLIELAKRLFITEIEISRIPEPTVPPNFWDILKDYLLPLGAVSLISYTFYEKWKASKKE